MRKGLKLTGVQKRMLKRLGYNPNNFRYFDKSPDNIEFLEIYSGKILSIYY